MRDIAHPETKAQAGDVAAILEDLGVTEATPQLEVWNKIDALDPEARAAAEAVAARRDDVILTSAITGEGLDRMVTAVTETLDRDRVEAVVTLDHSEGRKRAWAYEQGIVMGEEEGEDGVTLTLRWSPKQAAQFAKL